MKKLRSSSRASRNKKIACTVSAAALMLGVSSAATIGLHFQDDYCGSASYSGFVVTMQAFGIESNGWQNLLPMATGYGCPFTNATAPYIFTLNEVISTDTSTNGLNPLPNGSLNVTWSANGANFSGFAGYAGKPPSYAYDGHYPGAGIQASGEEEVYSSFLRDGLNFGADGPNGGGSASPCGNNDQPVYLVDVTGLKSLFTNGPFVVELVGSADSMQTLTNAFVIDATTLTTNSVEYPSTPTPFDEGGTCSQWLRGHGGGLSTVSPALNTDHIQITSNHPQHGGVGVPPNGFDNAGTIAGFIITDKPVITMSPQPVLAGLGDTVTLNPYAIGVPPLSFQWLRNGTAVPGATNISYTITNVTFANAGAYELVVTNVYGSATSRSVTIGDLIQQGSASNVVADSNPANPQHSGVNMGATWEASSSDGTTTRTGVMSFDAEETNGITVADNSSLDSTNGTITFWMRSAGTDQSASGSLGASLFCRTASTAGFDFKLLQEDGSPGTLYYTDPNNNGDTSTKGVSDNLWHFIALTFGTSDDSGVSLYIDGSLQFTNNNGASWSNEYPIEIGYTSDPIWRNYNGLLSDFRYYSAQLTASQVGSIYSSGAIVDTNDLQLRLNFPSAPGSGVSLTWLEGTAVLQSAPTLDGPWTDLPGAVSPYTIVPGVGQQFFRYRYIHSSQVLTSNPYLM
ncbi:MAG TPA: LamG-like jellyroll fold domain-containing protein [Verrucomicrobiae bacterium]|jgi:hypothetical protein|nr:LamG-like jellyroll fold domain-containing protein [Verrucomicrobiae bacterium]